MQVAFVHGIRFRLLLASLVLLAIPALAAQFINRMETFLRAAQEQDIAVTARAVSSALSDRPALFPPGDSAPGDPDDEERRRIVALFAAADTIAAASLGSAYAPSEEIERFLDILGRRASRLWVVDTRSRVRGLSGTLREPPPSRANASRTAVAGWLKPVVSLVVSSPEVPAGDESKPVRAQIDRALIGVSSTYWRGTKDREVAILSAAQPVFVGDDIVGAVVVEETTASILLLRQSALENLIALTLAVCLAAFAILLFFASRLATRIRRLHAEAESAIDAQGRIRGAITPTGAKDEIGDLERTISAVLGRLRDYNAYLEQMAGRLSHELRTPVAVVRSSLDNLRSQSPGGEARVYLDRADVGVDRLSRLISRLSEGTRLEKMLESAERESFDLAAVVRGCVEGYRTAYPGRAFECELPAAEVMINGVPDALAQLLDKLVENALDFAPAGSAIRIGLSCDGRLARLGVANDGPPIPAAMLPRLFDAMVSAREEGHGRGGHLGLGLAIVRLVAEFHGGTARAANLADGRGVYFEVELAAQGPRHPA
ncbi:MAG TPA: ATP-binding protein [Usitatibacteraceae bacterium]|nr:ATP-binding protein [Usitatibacteraceae bacterium]